MSKVPRLQSEVVVKSNGCPAWVIRMKKEFLRDRAALDISQRCGLDASQVYMVKL